MTGAGRGGPTIRRHDEGVVLYGKCGSWQPPRRDGERSKLAHGSRVIGKKGLCSCEALVSRMVLKGSAWLKGLIVVSRTVEVKMVTSALVEERGDKSVAATEFRMRQARYKLNG